MAWRNILVLGVVASCGVVGCTVTADGSASSDAGMTGNDTGGSSGDAATGTGGKSTGGAKGTGGGGATSTGGAKSTGGSDGGGALACAPNVPNLDVCQKCLESTCCTDWLDCQNDVECSDPDITKPGLMMFHDCMSGLALGVDGGILDPTSAAACATSAGAVQNGNSEALFDCMMGAAADAGTPAAPGCMQDCYGVTF